MDQASGGAPVRLKSVSKYRNVRTVVDGITFQSKKEAKRWQELKLLWASTEILFLERQPRFKLEVCGQLVATYVADFRYFDVKPERWIVEDCKGMRTREYLLKKKLMKAIHGIEILET